MNDAVTSIKFIVGSRQVFEVRRTLRTVSLGLKQLIERSSVDFGADDTAHDGFRILSVPRAMLGEIADRFPDHVVGGMRHYRWHYIEMTGSFANYLTRFSGKTRSTFNRKRRNLADYAGGSLDIQEFRTPAHIAQFFTEAIPLSQRTYQSRLLDAGLPESEAAKAEALALAAQDRLRAYLLRINGKAVAHLYLPVEGETLIYAFLGYDPDFARHSPGTVLQLDALERLFAEGRFRYFDFTEGDGAHKEMFGTSSVDACSFFLLRPTLANRMLIRSLNVFDGLVAWARGIAVRSGGIARLRRVLRG
jgi:CelD/BcsL family acetyltransferase involved in cellulose biosynthesis